MEEKNISLIAHLEELRKVLLVSALGVLAGMAAGYAFFREAITALVFGPLLGLGVELVVIGVTEAFFTQVKVFFFSGEVLGSPIVFWQVIGFVLPALYRRERKIFWLALISAVALFFSGVFFGYRFLLAPALQILLLDFAGSFQTMISAGKYVSFFITFLLPFGLVFEVPLATLLLCRAGLITPAMLRKQRRYVVVAAFILAAVLTPTGDVVTQTLLALPILALYELSIVIAAVSLRRK